MKKIILLCLAAAALVSCGDRVVPSGNLLTVKRNVTEFNAIAVAGAINATVTMGEEQTLEITADDNVLSYIETFVRDGVLNVRVKNRTSFRGSPTLKASIGAVELSACSASGASTIKFVNTLAAPRLSIDLSGASRYTGSIEVGQLTAELSGASSYTGTIEADQMKAALSGASSVTTGGTASKLALTCSGASSFGDFDFAADEVNATLSGASHVTLTVNENLSVKATGASSLRYKGQPTIGDLTLEGGSTVESAD